MIKVLITGTAGFIGFSLANRLLCSKNVKVYGIDNFDHYYSVKIKKRTHINIKEKQKFFF